MSVLFNALHKAARDYRNQKAPTLVPLIAHRPVSFVRKRAFVSACALGLLFVLLGAVFFGAGQAATNSKEAAVKNVATQPLTAKGAPLLKNARKMREDEPLGIALSASSGETEKSESEVRKTAKTRAADPALSIKMEGEREAPSAPVEVGALASAKKALGLRQWERALTLYNVALKKNRGDTDALKGKIAALEGRGGDADLEALDQIAESHPKLASVHAARAAILIRQKDTLEALAAWEKAAALEPKNRDYRLALAILNDKLGRVQEALEAYRAIPKPLPQEAKRRMEYLAAHADFPSQDDAGDE